MDPVLTYATYEIRTYETSKHHGHRENDEGHKHNLRAVCYLFVGRWVVRWYWIVFHEKRDLTKSKFYLARK